jgi:hypothetical protein
MDKAALAQVFLRVFQVSCVINILYDKNMVGSSLSVFMQSYIPLVSVTLKLCQLILIYLLFTQVTNLIYLFFGMFNEFLL